MQTDDIYFGYRISMFGSPTCWKGDKPDPSCIHSTDDPYYPFRLWKKLAPEEVDLSLDELRKRYPFKQG